MRKDLSYAIDEAATHGVTLSIASAARDRYDKAVQAGLGEADFSAVVEPIRGAARRA
jgi:3-hydroxyisobutyrate dehydrogenase-like beta-hydroxyacid dehydrogenase